MSKNIVLLDGDYIAFISSAGKDDYPVEEVTALVEEKMNYILSSCKEAFMGKDTEYITFLSGRKNNRKELYPDYKSNRKDRKLPTHLSAARLFLSAFWNGVTVEGIEADDAIGICSNNLPTETTIIATADKDFAQMKNIWVYDIYPMRLEYPRKYGQPFIEKELTEDGLWYRTSEVSARKQLMYQLIYGDAGDGIKGLTQYKGKKRGHKKAAWERVCNIADKSNWENHIEIASEIGNIYSEEFGEEEGIKLYDKVFDLVYIAEDFCEELKEIPKSKKYE